MSNRNINYKKMGFGFGALVVCLISFFFYFKHDPNVFVESQNTAKKSRLPSSAEGVQSFPNDLYLSKIQPILTKRCVACHSCIEAPCFLKFSAYEGLQRGLTPEYYPAPLQELAENRLKDARTFVGLNNSPKWDQPEWAKKNFAPIFKLTTDGKLDFDKSLFIMTLHRGKANIPGFSLDPTLYSQDHICPQKSEDLEAFYRKFPQSGMPYGLPALTETEYLTITDWLEKGAPGPTTETKKNWDRPTLPNGIIDIENFLNTSNLKYKLSARYIYEHAVLAHIHFEGTPSDEFYELVRANNLYGNPNEVVTPKGNDPILIPFYYRLKRVHEVIVRKSHALWKLNERSVSEWKSMFIDPVWKNEKKIKSFLNMIEIGDKFDPFKYFEIIPEEIRLSFMVKNAEMIVGEIIISPSCTGKLATLALKDHFWVFFMKPFANEKFNIIQEKSNLVSAISGTLKPLIFDDISENKSNLSIDENHLDSHMALSIFRHDNNVSVNKGLIGGDPQSIWLLDYHNYEDLYYNLVINYRPFGNYPHQYSTWQHFVKNRKTAEKRFLEQFISGEPSCPNCGQWLWDRWEKSPEKRKADEELSMNKLLRVVQNKMVTLMDESSGIKGDELNNLATSSIQNPLSSLGKWEKQMLLLTHKKMPKTLESFPDLTYIRIFDENNKEIIYSLINNRVYETNNNFTKGYLDQYSLILPEENTLVMVRGLVGNHPNLIVNLTLENAFSFANSLREINSFDDWIAFRKKFGLSRNSESFWKIYDQVTIWQQVNDTLNAGVIDLSIYQMFE